MTEKNSICILWLCSEHIPNNAITFWACSFH